MKDRELEESEERHMMEVKVFKQKVKHLLYEQENNIAEIKAENMVSLKARVIISLQIYFSIVQCMHDVKKKIGHMYFTCISQEFNMQKTFLKFVFGKPIKL